MVELNKSDSPTGEFQAWPYGYSFFGPDNLLVFICNFVFYCVQLYLLELFNVFDF